MTVPIMQIAYDGSRFYGSQLQPNHPTVQSAIEKALGGLCMQEPPRILFAGRTDRGVHATGQVMTIRGGLKPPLDKAADLVDKRLPSAIQVVAFAQGTDDFNPRSSATERTYHYVLRPGDDKNPFLDSYSLAVAAHLDFEAMRRASDMLVGTHSFLSFATSPSEQVRITRELRSISFHQTDNRMVIEFKARAFLRGQIRNIMGALLAVGEGKCDLEYIAALLAAKEKSNVPKPAPPVGLYLSSVQYPEELFQSPFELLNGRQKGLDPLLFA